MAERLIFLVRHGQYHFDGQNRGRLTELGWEQARYTGDLLQRYRVNRILCSTLPRAQETAKVIGRMAKRTPQEDELLVEAVPSIPPRMAETILQMMENDPTLTHAAIHEHKKRADAAFERYFVPVEGDAYQIDVLVAHGNIIRYFACCALGVNHDTWAKFDIGHASISSVTIGANGAMSLVSWNEMHHIPGDMRSS